MTTQKRNPISTRNTIPAVVTSYFERMGADDKRPAVDLFTADARVSDDGHSYLGRHEILRWLTTAASEYTVTTTRLGAETAGDTTIVSERLNGNFPGGTVELRSIFTVRPDGLISALTIAP